jgi:hypothetical protein
MQAWRVETREPHVVREHDREWGVGVTELVGECLATRLVAVEGAMQAMTPTTPSPTGERTRPSSGII